MKHQWAQAGNEPSLAELLSDPITHQVLRRDRLTPEMVWSAICTARNALRRRALQTANATGKLEKLDEHGCEAA